MIPEWWFHPKVGMTYTIVQELDGQKKSSTGRITAVHGERFSFIENGVYETAPIDRIRQVMTNRPGVSWTVTRPWPDTVALPDGI